MITKYECCERILIFLIIAFLILYSLEHLSPYPERRMICSIWENGSLYPDKPFNCYCPAGDTAAYANVKYPELCDGDYLEHKFGVSNYYNEIK